jgi:hypothetical protein
VTPLAKCDTSNETFIHGREWAALRGCSIAPTPLTSEEHSTRRARRHATPRRTEGQTRHRHEEKNVTETINNQSDSLGRRTSLWVLAIGFAGLVFNGYELVVYGTVVPTLLRDPQWAVTVGARNCAHLLRHAHTRRR